MKSKTTTEFQNVYLTDVNRKGKEGAGYFWYSLRIKGKIFKSSKSVSFTSARDCAIALDIKLIENGLEPINILKRRNEG